MSLFSRKPRVSDEIMRIALIGGGVALAQQGSVLERLRFAACLGGYAEAQGLRLGAPPERLASMIPAVWAQLAVQFPEISKYFVAYTLHFNEAAKLFRQNADYIEAANKFFRWSYDINPFDDKNSSLNTLFAHLSGISVMLEKCKEGCRIG